MKTICKTMPIDIPIYGKEDRVTVYSTMSISSVGGLSLNIPPAVVNLGTADLTEYLTGIIIPETLEMIDAFKKI